MSNYSTPNSKSNFKIIAGNNKAPAERKVRVGGVAPPTDMPAGEYVTICEGAKVDTKWGKSTAVVAFRVADGKYFGVSLRAFFKIDLIGEVTTAGCRYNQLCEIALGRPVESGDDLHPSRIFPGKTFKVLARYSSTTSDKRRLPLDASIRKSASDLLRVGTILELLEGGL
jgi:hypothetical protein